jgi:hypothetical protein
MSHAFKVGDAVRWNSEAGEIHGKVTKVHVKDVEFMGKHRPASKDEPQYEVKSDKTGLAPLLQGRRKPGWGYLKSAALWRSGTRVASSPQVRLTR